MDQTRIERSIWIDAPRERVWQAVTEPAQIGRWLLPPALGAELARAADGALVVNMGGMEIPLATLDVVEPERQAISYGLPDRLIATTYRLGEKNGGTEVSVTMTGFEKLPAETRREYMTPSAAAWEKGLLNLQAAVAGADLPFPEGYVTGLFGYRRQAETFAVERSIWIAAPCERVWRAMVDPAQIERWFSPGTAWELTALEPGGRLFVRDQETGGELYTQVIERLEPPHLLVQRSETPVAGTSEVTAYRLNAEDGGTRLTITHHGYETMPEDTRWAAMEQNGAGFGMMLANIKASIEGTDLPQPGGF
jgi:uncharacterized protein YndB with AHSA1/START domain